MQGSRPADDRITALLGSRVVARHRLSAPDPVTGATLTDVVGELVAADAQYLTITTRSGTVRVSRAHLVALKQVPPRPVRRGAAHLAISIEDLQRAMLLGWGAVERGTLGDWQLRASGGFTQRGNSTVPVGSPGRPLREAVDRVEEWYAARLLPACFALAGPEGFRPDDDPLGAELLSRGYTTAGRTLVLTQRTAAVAALDPGGPPVTLTSDLGPQWLLAYGQSRPTVSGTTEKVLLDAAQVRFGAIAPGGGLSQRPGLRAGGAPGTTPVAVARLSVGAGWAGLGAVWTDPAYRGRGLAAHLTARLAAHAQEGGTDLVHLQVEADNGPALRLYRRMGFAVHSAYAYLTAGQSMTP